MSPLREAAPASRDRSAFGNNWAKFLGAVDERRIAQAERSLREMLGTEGLAGKTFLDLGSGSGLFSLAARRLGATVRAVDFDPQSVACTVELRRRHFPGDPRWVVERGSALDREHLARLGTFDVVYSWGVLHHTGALWEALGNVAPLVRAGGALCIAVYNDQGWRSAVWLAVKRAYNLLPRPLRGLVLWPAFLRLWGPTTLRDLVRGRPFETWRRYPESGARGMSPWRDVVDWVGGLPFEVARPEEIVAFFAGRGFALERAKPCGGGFGCNEFVFRARPA